MNRCDRLCAPRGFTLIEIAVVLLIVGLVTVYGARLMTFVNEGFRVRATRQNIDQVKQALQAYVARMSRLPCPAVETLAQTATDYGKEAPTAGTCTGTTAIGTTVAFRGVVPWKTLGMTAENAFDAWGRQITYVVSQGATNLSSTTVAGMTGGLYVHSAVPVAAGLPATGNQINACSTTADDNSCNAAAVVLLISFGTNGWGAFGSNGTQVPAPSSASEVENTDTDRNYVIVEPSSDFDDIVVPFSPYDVLAPMYLNNTLKPPQALVVERARQAVSLIAADAVSTRSGSSGSYVYALPVNATTAYTWLVPSKFDGACDNNPPTLVGTLTGDAAQVLDPWGRAFRFSRASNSINGAESCPTPIAFVSLGPDGTLATTDDIEYYSTLAEWKSIFEKSGW